MKGKKRKPLTTQSQKAHKHNWLTYGYEVIRIGERSLSRLQNVYCHECGTKEEVDIKLSEKKT